MTEAREEQEGLRIRLPAEPGNVSLLRQAAGSEAQKAGMEPAQVEDLRTAVSEACANIVLHAYAGEKEPGAMEMEITPLKSGVRAVVRDFGKGLRPAFPRRRESLGLGLMLIGALSTCFQLRSARQGGTEVRFQVPLSGEGAK